MNSAGLAEAPVERDLGCGLEIWRDNRISAEMAIYAKATARTNEARGADLFAFVSNLHNAPADGQLIYQLPAFPYLTEDFSYGVSNIYGFAAQNEANLLIAKRLFEVQDIESLRAIVRTSPGYFAQNGGSRGTGFGYGK
ncbi:MAG: hypothetical protein GC136_03685 [Alphaproteobacteria bacterium]|nr:hypothetical protein [Alphaproteobacteria bacterium]